MLQVYVYIYIYVCIRNHVWLSVAVAIKQALAERAMPRPLLEPLELQGGPTTVGGDDSLLTKSCGTMNVRKNKQ